MTHAKYIPGVCNIGPAEMLQRRQLGVMMLVVTLAVYAVFVALRAPDYSRALIVLLPAIISASGFLQYYFHFCAGFGMSGLFNFRDSVGQTDSVDQAEWRKKDKKRALQIFSYSCVVGVFVSIIAYVLPLRVN